MESKFNILTEFIKDMSCETKNAQTYLHVKDVIKNYHLDFAIKAKPMKNKLIEVDTTLNFKDPNNNEKQSFFEIVYTAVVKIDDNLKESDLKKILLCEVPNPEQFGIAKLTDNKISVGDKINQGDIIGTVGSTGRSTGPHLDFRVNWFQTRLDPMSVIN